MDYNKIPTFNKPEVCFIGRSNVGKSSLINRIAKNKNRFTLFLGDQIDAINIYDKRFNPDTVVEHDIDNQTMGWQ